MTSHSCFDPAVDPVSSAKPNSSSVHLPFQFTAHGGDGGDHGGDHGRQNHPLYDAMHVLTLRGQLTGLEATDQSTQAPTRAPLSHTLAPQVYLGPRLGQ